MEEEVEASAMQSYLDWLYSGEVRIDKVVDRRLGNKNVAILKCWAVALAVKDDAFKDAIEDVFREEARECYEQDMVRWHLQATISIQKREVLLSTTSLKV